METSSPELFDNRLVCVFGGLTQAPVAHAVDAVDEALEAFPNLSDTSRHGDFATQRTTRLYNLLAMVACDIDSALQSLAAADSLSLRISGDCMNPLIRDGSMVQVRAQKCYLPGDILVVRLHCGCLAAHRLIGVFSNSKTLKYLTHADSANKPDAAVSRGRIIGCVCGGNCDVRAFKIPLADRIRAVLRFSRFMVSYVVRKVR